MQLQSSQRVTSALSFSPSLLIRSRWREQMSELQVEGEREAQNKAGDKRLKGRQVSVLPVD